ncbi:PP2C family serine/threonine-protein phosphatase [Lautropia mirabilis]|uniref:PP2C family serine/threonine-protein phosphatase n=1 Tax=Lautropia mirabilis TaxID=47671 RepID=UPI0028E54E31|nr:PP2C family serine/threonine-protein phosphatase [Lautropia mirabilis]
MKHWSWIAATSTGTSHLKHNLPLQDAQACTVVSIRSDSQNCDAEWFVAVTCDGAGSASHGRQGAIITCRTLRQAARRHLAAASAPSASSLQETRLTTSALPSAETVRTWADEARQRIHAAAERRGLSARDFACTLVLTLSNGQETLVAHIGDGGIVARLADGGTWQALSWPDHGEYASTTRFVTDEPPTPLRTHITRQPIDALALFSDGIERMVLDMATQTPFERFFSAMAAPLPPEPGRAHTLSRQLKAYLDSDAVNSRTDDDKTLVMAVLHSPPSTPSGT